MIFDSRLPAASSMFLEYCAEIACLVVSALTILSLVLSVPTVENYHKEIAVRSY